MARRRGFIYGRQSRTAGDSESVAEQVARCREAAERHGVEVVDVILEPPSTGAYKDRGRRRPRFPDLIEGIASGRGDCVIAYKTDRLSRGGGPGWAPLFDAAEAAGIKDVDRFVLVPSGWVSEFEIGVRAAMDREESKKTSDRVKGIKTRAAAAGRPNGGGHRPFGYASDRITIVEEEAGAIRDAADRFLAGEGLRSIARSWNAAGLRTPTGREWRGETLRQIFMNPRIAGLRGHVDPDRKGPGAWHYEVVGKAVWDPIVEPGTWEALQAYMKARSVGGRRPVKFLLSGVLHCSRCGAKLGTGPKQGRPAYSCLKRPGTTNCGGISIKAEDAEEVLVAMALHRLSSPALEAALGTRTARTADGLVDEILRLEAKLEEFATMLGGDEITHTEWKAMRTPVDARLTAARAQLERSDFGPALDGLVGVRNLDEVWASLPFDRRRAVLSAVYERVDVIPARRGLNRFDPDRLAPTWRDRAA